MDDDDRTYGSSEAPASQAPASQAPASQAPTLAVVPGAARQRSPEDDRAMALLAAGARREAIEVLIVAHEEAVFAYCVRMLRDRELAEDVAQQVFCEAHRDLERFRGEASLKTWLIGIAHHRCGDAIKSRNRRSARIDLDQQAVIDHVDPSSEPSERLDRARLGLALEHCLQELSPDIRETVLLRFLPGLTYEEMSTLLGRKADTLCVRVARAMPILKRCLERKGWKHE